MNGPREKMYGKRKRKVSQVILGQPERGQPPCLVIFDLCDDAAFSSEVWQKVISASILLLLPDQCLRDALSHLQVASNGTWKVAFKRLKVELRKNGGKSASLASAAPAGAMKAIVEGVLLAKALDGVKPGNVSPDGQPWRFRSM